MKGILKHVSFSENYRNIFNFLLIIFCDPFIFSAVYNMKKNVDNNFGQNVNFQYRKERI